MSWLGELWHSANRMDRERPWLLPATILAGGILARILWIVLTNKTRWATAEMAQTAIAFARTGVLADAYMPGQGPTAHVNPITPAFAGTIYHMLGIRSIAAETVLVSCAILISILTFLGFYVLFLRLGTPRWASIGALSACSFSPIFQRLEIGEFRIWEGGLSLLIAVSFLLLITRIENFSLYSDRKWHFIISAIAAILFFIAPAFGVMAYFICAWSMFINVPSKEWMKILIISFFILISVVGPWAIRNTIQLGSPVFLRSNFGLEISLAYYEMKNGDYNSANAFNARMTAIHPYLHPKAFAKMKEAGGEVAYARALGNEAKQWIASHPRQAAGLTALHVWNYFFPPKWQLRIDYANNALLPVRQALIWAISALGLIGAVFAATIKNRHYQYTLLMMLGPTMLYAITQPTIRYYYSAYPFLVFFGANAISLLQERWSKKDCADRT